LDVASFRVERSANTGRFELHGELDIAGRSDLIEALQTELASGGGDVTLDLSSLSFVDSTGVSALLGIARQLGPSRHLILEAPQPPVARVFDLVQLARMPAIQIVSAAGEAGSPSGSPGPSDT